MFWPMVSKYLLEIINLNVPSEVCRKSYIFSSEVFFFFPFWLRPYLKENSLFLWEEEEYSLFISPKPFEVRDEGICFVL